MTTISITPETLEGTRHFRAISGDHESTGNTPGEALDAMTRQLDEEETGTMVVFQQFKPDQFFTAEQQSRIMQLMKEWRSSRDEGRTFPPEKQTELEQLVEAEQEGMARRAAARLGESIP